MTLLRNLFFLFAITVFAITSTVLSIYNYNPFESNAKVLVNFYASFAISLAGLLGLAVYYIRSRAKQVETVNLYFWPSVRQGILLSTGLTIILILQGFRILDWLVGISVMAVVILCELFFETKKFNK